MNKTKKNAFFQALFWSLLAHMAEMLTRTVMALWFLDYTYYCYRWWYVIICLLLPPAAFIFSTMLTELNFHRKKKLLLALCLMSEILSLVSFLFKMLSRIFLPLIFSLPPGKAFTKTMIVLTGRILVEIPVLLLALLLILKVKEIFYKEENLKPLLAFRISHFLEQKESIYDLRIVKDINTGQYVTVTEKDRFLHMLCDGSSGTGKTSSTILPAIKNDLDARCRMEDKQMSALKEMELQGEIFYVSSGRQIGISDFYPVVESDRTEEAVEESRLSEIKKKLNQIALSYPVAGITVLAPDDSLTDDVCRLCEARNVTYNRIDPTRDLDGRRKKNCIGMNPFYLRDGIGGADKNQLIVKKAVVFADVMQAITELKGKSDSYFSGVNRQMIANLAILVMLTIPVLHKRQATPMDLQEVINDFDKLKLPLTKLKELDQGINQYQFVIKYIEFDLLGSGRSKMEDQSRGTRNIINEFLLMPYNREVFCSQESIDFDRALANGEVTVCNYNLAAGDTDATAFGLFFLLSFNNAVLSRSGTEHTRTPHFFYVDELPVLIHPSIEKNFSLFRKYRVAMFVAIQTLDQMEKNEVTKYLKGVILGCAHILVFGRSSLTDMEVFSKFAGVKDKVEEETGTTQSSLSDADTKLTYTARESLKQKNVLEEIDIRMKDFQEVTFFTTRNGRPLEAVHGKVDFLRAEDWEKKQRKEIRFTDIRQISGNALEEEKEEKRQSPLFENIYSEQKFQKESMHIIKRASDPTAQNTGEDTFPKENAKRKHPVYCTEYEEEEIDF